MLGVTDPTVLAALRFEGFLAGADEEYDFVRAGMDESQRFLAQN
jgi:hypothetical protein